MQQSPPPRSASHVPVLDGLRAIAVLLVLWQHVPTTTPGYPEWLLYASIVGPGGLGVRIFFVLSGFLITRILLAEHVRGLPLWRFMVRRLLRIFPIYYLLLAVLWIVEGGSERLAFCALYVSNFWFIFGEAPIGGNLQHTWSLCIEEHFYLLWPPAIALLAREGARRLLVFVVLPVAVASAPLGLLLVEPGRFDPWVAHSSIVQFLHLGLGCLLAFGEERIAARPRRFAVIGGAACLVGALCSRVVFALLPFLWFEAPPIIGESYWPFLDFAYTALVPFGAVTICLALRDSVFLRWMSTVPLRAIGRISYGLYLYHLPIFFWLLYGELSGQNVLVALVVTFGVATSSYLVIERPLLRYGAKFR